MDNPSYGYGFSYGYGYGFGWGYYDPWEVARDLVRAAIRILKDEPLFDESIFRSVRSAAEGMRDGAETAPPAEMGLVGRLLRRFVLGLPVVGAGSLIHMLLSFPLLGPVQWLARRCVPLEQKLPVILNLFAEVTATADGGATQGTWQQWSC